MRGERYFLMHYIESVSALPRRPYAISYDPSDGVYRLVASNEFRILHLTDIHLGGSLFSSDKDLSALAACAAEIRWTRPDLVIVTGDLCLPQGVSSLSFDNVAPIRQFASFMSNLGVPWTFTYGNHDGEPLAVLDNRGLDSLFRELAILSPDLLLYPQCPTDSSGRSDRLLEIVNEDGGLRMALFLLDSGGCADGDLLSYDYVRDDQVERYRQEVMRLSAREGSLVPSLIFLHIPLTEYRTAWELYRRGSSDVSYFFGANRERPDGKVHCSEHPSALFDAVVELGSTQGIFCGHDHENNISLEYRGVRLTYGMSIDYLTYPGIAKRTVQRGGELIAIAEDGSWSVEQVPLKEIEGRSPNWEFGNGNGTRIKE